MKSAVTVDCGYCNLDGCVLRRKYISILKQHYMLNIIRIILSHFCPLQQLNCVNIVMSHVTANARFTLVRYMFPIWPHLLKLLTHNIYRYFDYPCMKLYHTEFRFPLLLFFLYNKSNVTLLNSFIYLYT